MKQKLENIDWKSKFLNGEMPLYDALLMYMLEGRVVPMLLVEKYVEVIDDYKDGRTEDLEIGLENQYQKSKARRASDARRIDDWAHLPLKLELFTNIGLKLVKPDSVKEKHSADTISSLKSILLAHKPRLRFQPEELEFMTAYQAVGKIFNKSEATIRKKLES